MVGSPRPQLIVRAHRETARISALERRRAAETQAWGAVVASTEAGPFLAFPFVGTDGQGHVVLNFPFSLAIGSA